MPEHVRYRDDLETIAPDEAETFAKIVDLMTRGMHLVREKAGESVRVSHAKAHGFVTGTLAVDADLPAELAQGLFARPATYDALVRLATAPGENLDDRTVSTQRGMAIKVMGVDGEMLGGGGGGGGATQDFVLDSGTKEFIASDAATFLQSFKPNALLAPRLPEAVKGAVSKTARAAGAALETVGVESPKLDFYGHPKYHPLAEAYYSQCPMRWGEHVAKLAVVPANPALEALYEKVLDVPGENGLRTMTVDYFKANAAEYDVCVQLCTDPEEMPIEDATAKWDEDKSPYRRVGRLTLPAQDAYDERRQDVVDHRMSFSPAHSLAAHRPLGSVMRARLAVYPVVAGRRRSENGVEPLEPAAAAADVPG